MVPGRRQRQRQPHYAKNERAEAPAGIGRVCRGFCLQLTPVPVAMFEATFELMTARLAELVNARIVPLI
jgi:hypothetical protein